MSRKKAQGALKLSEEQFRRAIEDAPIPTIMHAEDGQVLLLSRTWTELTGYTINDVPDFDTWLTKVAYGEGANEVRDHMHKLFEGHKKSLNVDFQIRALDGSIRFWSFSASSPGTLRDGRRFIIGMAVDITDRKRHEKTISSLAKFPLENPAAVLRVNRQGIIMYANPVAQSFLNHWQTKVGERVPHRIMKMVVDSLASNNKTEFEENKGEETYAFLTAPIVSEDYANLYGRSITKRKKAEAALQASEHKFKTLAENAPDPIMRFDENLRITYLNPADLAVTGLTLEKVVGKTNEELGMPAELCKVWNDLFDRAKTTRQTQQAEFDFNSVTGLRTFNLRIVPEFAEDGSLISYIGISRDITERRKAEEALKTLNDELDERVKQRTAQVSEERQRLYKVLESLPSYVILLDKDHRVVFSNKVFRESFGVDHGRRCHEYLFNKDYECENCETYKVHKENKPQHWYWTGPNGRDYDIYDFPFMDMDGSTLILEMGIDITERKKLEKQLKDSERMIAIGQTAGMVGHDIRNPLQSMASDVYLAKSDLESIPDGDAKEGISESLDGIQQNIEYINKIVQDLQDYARPLKPAAKEVDLQSICEEVLFKNGVPENVEASCKLTDDAKIVTSDADLLKRVLSNLVSNAIQAMPEGGKLTIFAYKDKLTADIVIDVEDSGCGIPESVKPNLFTPMFTTKSRGQGFGLSVVKRITESMGGTISFESIVDKGTTFRVRLPPPKR